MERDLSNFKHVLEYFVAHQNYMQSGCSKLIKGYDQYIKPYIEEGTFASTGQGYKDDSIQKQIKEFENICSHRLCINIQPNYGRYTSRKSYLNWKNTGLNIFCEWKNDEVIALSIGYAYWWMKPTGYEIKLSRSIKELNLFVEGGDDSLLEQFLNAFIQEILDYDGKRGDYYQKEQEFHRKEKQIKTMDYLKNYLKILESNHNLILTGAPGTGKTYLAKQIAQQMVFGEIKNHMSDEEEKLFNEQCCFVQFHPSYDYTDFVEGLRPKKDDDGNIGFERKNGVFKEFSKNALLSFSNQHGRNDIELCFDESWQKLLDYVRERIAKGELTKIGIWEYGLSSAESLKYTSLDTPSKYTFTITKKNVYDAYRGLKARPSGYFQKYIEDVVKFMKERFGLKPYDKTETAKAEKEKVNPTYVFIIDEINRGEISKIFGELFFSIDPGYRGIEGKVKTQYQSLIEEDDEFYDGFYVPENVYIIGTMNDIDRSVESMDFAFRRRFAFKEITAKDSQIMLDSDDAWGKDNNGDSRKPSEEVIKIIKEKMEALNNLICPEKKNGKTEKGIEGLSSAYHIGASYFLKLVNYKKDDGAYNFDQLWENHLEGLLLEYMRGMENVSEKIKRLAIAFGYSKMEKYE